MIGAMKRPFRPTKGPKTQRLAQQRFMQLMYLHAHSGEEEALAMARDKVPDAWHILEMDLDVVEPKEKVSLYLDRSVLKIFRAMGKGYQARINRILSTWVQMKIADMVGFEHNMIDALEMTDLDRSETEPGESAEERRMTLEEHWAYMQGYMDALQGKPIKRR